MARVSVSPKKTTPSHTISLSDGAQTWGLRLEGDYKYIQETPQTPSTINLVQQGSEYGDADPSLSHIQQSEWVGGRGNERFVKDATRFYDSKGMWTMSGGVIHPNPQWHFAIGEHQKQNGIQPAKNYRWKSVTGIYYAVEFTPSANYTLSEVYLWIRCIGNPSELNVAIYTSDSDHPDAITTSIASLEYGDATEEPKYQKFTLDTAYSAVSGTKYFLVVYGNVSDNRQNHWEVMTVEFEYDYPSYTYTSTDNATWANSDFRLYFKTAETVTDIKYKFFIFLDDMYAVQIRTTGTSLLYKLVPTTPSFLWASHTDLVATLVSTTGLASVRDVCVVNNIVYFAQGASTDIRRWNGTSWASESTAHNKADIIEVVSDSINGTRIYVSISNYVKYSGIKDWGTELSYSNLNDFKNENVTGIIGFANSLWVMTSESIYFKSGEKNDGSNTSLSKYMARIDDSYNSTNGRASEVLGQYLYISVDKSIGQIYGSNFTDVGPHHGNGLPSDRVGFVTAMRSIFNKLFVALDAGDGYSSILVYDGVNWHELWRAPEAGKSINSLLWYSGKHVDNPLLVWDYGGEFVFMRFPYFGFNPSKEDTMYYAPCACIESSIIDMNLVSLPKMFKELSLVTKNLYNTRSDFLSTADNKNDAKIIVNYHVDSDIGSSNYIKAGEIYNSPYDTVDIKRSNVYALQYKLTFLTSDAAIPPLLNAATVKCFARTPVKYQWVMRIKTSSNQSTLNGAPDHKPDEILEWLKAKANSAEIVRMHSSVIDLDGKDVIVEPPATRRDYVDTYQKGWGGIITIVLREA